MCTQEKRILRLLINNEGRNLTTEEMVDYLYADDENGGPLTAKSVIGAVTSRIRKKLLPEYKIMLGCPFYSLHKSSAP